MKQPKKLTRNQKEVITKKGKNWKDYLLIDETDVSLKLYNKHTGNDEIFNKY
jgi:hypothetical protein